MSNVVLWDCDPLAESLRYHSIYDAVQAWAEDHDRPLPETVTVYGWERSYQCEQVEKVEVRVSDYVEVAE